MVDEKRPAFPYDAGIMPPRSKSPPLRKLYLTEHMHALGYTFESFGERMGVAKNTVWRWCAEPQRLDAEKLERIAAGLGLDGPDDLWYPPTQVRVDPLLIGVEAEKIQDVVDFVKKFILPPKQTR